MLLVPYKFVKKFSSLSDSNDLATIKINCSISSECVLGIRFKKCGNLILYLVPKFLLDFHSETMRFTFHLRHLRKDWKVWFVIQSEKNPEKFIEVNGVIAEKTPFKILRVNFVEADVYFFHK